MPRYIYIYIWGLYTHTCEFSSWIIWVGWSGPLGPPPLYPPSRPCYNVSAGSAQLHLSSPYMLYIIPMTITSNKKYRVICFKHPDNPILILGLGYEGPDLWPIYSLLHTHFHGPRILALAVHHHGINLEIRESYRSGDKFEFISSALVMWSHIGLSNSRELTYIFCMACAQNTNQNPLKCMQIEAKQLGFVYN